MSSSVIKYKQIGETPLDLLERFRGEQIEKAENQDAKEYWKNVPMTYAGRLDPLAEGELLILMGEECKNKEKYLNLDKEYEVEVLFGISTDTYDSLGLLNYQTSTGNFSTPFLKKYVGKFIQPYPAYSSKTVDGRQLHELARNDELPMKMPTKNVEIYSIDNLGIRQIRGKDIAKQAIENINKVRGDFRQAEIIAKWNNFLNKYPNESFNILKIRVKCSSGTYMRSLTDRMGKDSKTGAFAYSIKRTRIVLLM